MPDVFVSHATKDDDIVTKIHDRLTDAGLDVWVDHIDGIGAGDDFDESIQKGLVDCKMGLFVLSEKSAASRECRAEWRRILADNKKLYVAKISAIPKDKFPYRLGTIQYIDLEEDFDGGIAKLIAAMTGQQPLEAPTLASIAPRKFPHFMLDNDMLGRDDDFQAVLKSVRDNRLTWVTGLGGIGKTRMAVEVATQVDFADGVVWLRFEDYTDESELPLLLRQHLQLPETTDDDTTWQILAQKAVLVILDNAEECNHRQAVADRIRQTNIDGGTRFLITSRYEWAELKRVRTTPQQLAALERDPAAALVKQMANQDLSDDDAMGLAEAARYHPRLIEYAMGWLDDYPPNTVQTMLRDLKGADAEEALEDIVHRTIERVREGHGEAPMTALRRLAVCLGGFTIEAAEALINDISVLPILRRWNLVRFDGQRYDVDGLVRAAVGEDEDAKRLHYDYYKALANVHREKQDYLGLDVETDNLEAAFEWALAKQNADDAYWMANAMASFLRNRGRFRQNLDQMLSVSKLLEGSEDRELWASTQNNLGIAYQNMPIGNRQENLLQAIKAYEAALEHYTAEAAPLDYAMTQNNLGTAYADLSALEDRAGNLQRAIASYEAALAYRTAEAAPLDYAGTQNNLGIAYADLSALEDRAGNLGRAVASYKAALEHYTAEAAPLDYAMTQNNLGNAYADLSAVEDRAGNLQRAIEAYEAALAYRTAEAAPLHYAATQNNLGNAYADLSAVEDRAGNLQRAIEAYEAALEHYTAESAPLDYAMTQNNLGLAYRDLSAVEDRKGNLQRAIAAYEAALVYRTAEAAPLAYAYSQHGLGNIKNELGELEDAIFCWREAEKYYRQMDAIADADLMLEWIAEAEKRLP